MPAPVIRRLPTTTTEADRMKEHLRVDTSGRYELDAILDWTREQLSR